MTEKQAKNYFEQRAEYRGLSSKVKEAERLAAEALKREIPWPLDNDPIPCSVPVCGRCHGIMDLEQGELNYCPNCGQKIQWRHK